MTSRDIAHYSVAENASPMPQIATEHGEAHEHGLEWTDLARIAFVAVVAAAVWFKVWEPIHKVSVIGVIGLLVGGWPILNEAFENILARRMTMELSMTIAIVAAAAIGEFFTALVITLFVLIAEVLEGMTVSRGRRAIRDLLEFLPRTVSVRRAGSVREIDLDELALGDAVLVNPGGRVPVDGIVLSGHSYLDQSRITGESMPVEKTAGASVYAGSINQSGAIEIRVERVGRDTSFGKIIEAVERAEQSRCAGATAGSPAGGLSRVFCARCGGSHVHLDPRYPLDDFGRHRSRRLWDCSRHPARDPGRYRARGASRCHHQRRSLFETLGRVDTVVLDKTGTLTFGKPEVQAVVPVEGASQNDVLDTAAIAELRSEHPLGKAIVAYAQAAGRIVPEPEHFDYTPGRGIVARSGGAVLLVGNQALMNEHGLAVPAALSVGMEAASRNPRCS